MKAPEFGRVTKLVNPLRRKQFISPSNYRAMIVSCRAPSIMMHTLFLQKAQKIDAATRTTPIGGFSRRTVLFWPVRWSGRRRSMISTVSRLISRQLTATASNLSRLREYSRRGREMCQDEKLPKPRDTSFHAKNCHLPNLDSEQLLANYWKRGIVMKSHYIFHLTLICHGPENPWMEPKSQIE